MLLGEQLLPAPALDGFPEQSWGRPNLPCKPRVCTSLHMASAHAVLPGPGNKAEPPCLGLGLALGDEDGDSMKRMGTDSMKAMGLHCVLLAPGAGSEAELGSAGARGDRGAMGA